MFAYSPDETIYPLLSEKSDFQGSSCWEPSLDHATPSFDIRLWLVNDINCLLWSLFAKIKQFRFAYLESFIFYASQRREWSRKQMQLSWLFAMLALVSDWFQICRFPHFRVSAFPVCMSTCIRPRRAGWMEGLFEVVVVKSQFSDPKWNLLTVFIRL